MTSRTAQKRKRTQASADEVDSLERTLKGRGPRCECRHGSSRCLRRAAHRVSALCREVGCRRAVHVYTVCSPCKDEWVDHAARCRHCPELRVTAL